MSLLRQTTTDLEAVVERMVPRILSQVCRDPHSLAYGAFDRDWWHYKIRDFPSIILQQGGYAVWLAGELGAFAGARERLRELALAACRFWAARAVRRGAFEEYYPWEEGYPPLAFSTLAVMRLAREGVVPESEIEGAAECAARQLIDRFEADAANQQIAGLAALALLDRQFPGVVPGASFERIQERSLELQSEEGWFPEYGGPDLGYLSVALDCLWDLHDATGNAVYLDSAGKAFDYLAALLPAGSESVGMHNSRNTDYVLPYGIVRFLVDDTGRRAAAASLFARLYAGVRGSNHFVHAIDDRYLCHYTGHSLLRACLALRRFLAASEAEYDVFASAPEGRSDQLFPRSGQFVRSSAAEEGARLLISLKKGGIWSFRSGAVRVADFGWVATIGKNQFVSHWWSDHWKWEKDGNGFRVEGSLVPHRERLSSPAAHLALRIASLFFGRRLIRWLKRLLIFHEAESRYHFERRIRLDRLRVEVRDRISDLPACATVVAAPRSSKRHVASADVFHHEDLSRIEAVTCETSARRTADGFEAEAVYQIDCLP